MEEAMTVAAKPHHQLELIGLEEARRLATETAPTKALATRALGQIQTTHEIASALPGPQDMAFLHAGFCQTCLPHRRLASNSTVWKRRNGACTLFVRPGPNIDAPEDSTSEDYVGVPYGPKARLI